MKEACDALEIDAPRDTDVLLDLARVVAHKVERRAAPVTTYIVGLAVAGRDDVDVATAARRLMDLARSDEGAG